MPEMNAAPPSHGALSAYLDLVRAVMHLGRARWKLGNWTTGELLRSSPDIFTAQTHAPPRPDRAGQIDRVSRAIARIGGRLPWRSDCLVQALAAQYWLKQCDIASSIWIGVRRDVPSGFEAHAWLKVGDRVVTGGDVSKYHAIVKPGSQEARPGTSGC